MKMKKDIVQIIAPNYNWSENIIDAKKHVEYLRNVLSTLEDDIKILIADDYSLIYDEITKERLLYISLYSESDIRQFIIRYMNNIFNNTHDYGIFLNFFNNEWEFHSKNYAHIMESYIKEKNLHSSETINKIFWFIIYFQSLKTKIVN